MKRAYEIFYNHSMAESYTHTYTLVARSFIGLFGHNLKEIVSTLANQLNSDPFNCISSRQKGKLRTFRWIFMRCGGFIIMIVFLIFQFFCLRFALYESTLGPKTDCWKGQKCHTGEYIHFSNIKQKKWIKTVICSYLDDKTVLFSFEKFWYAMAEEIAAITFVDKRMFLRCNYYYGKKMERRLCDATFVRFLFKYLFKCSHTFLTIFSNGFFSFHTKHTSYAIKEKQK